MIAVSTLTVEGYPMHVFKQQYSRTIPENAERLVHDGRPAVRWKGRDKRWVVGYLIEGKPDRCLVESKKWYGRVDGDEVPLCANKTVAEQMLTEKLRKAARREIDPAFAFEEQCERALSEHVADWRQALAAKDTPRRQIAEAVTRACKLLDGCKAVGLSDLTHPDLPRRVEAWLADFRQVPGLPDLPTDKVE